MTTKYAFTGEVPMIFADLSHGPDVVVEHVHPVFAGEQIEDPDGSTVVLYPGDTITIGREYGEHAYLEPLDVAGEIVGAKLTVADLKTQLTELGIEIPAKAKKTDLEALLADHIPTITEDGIIPPESTPSGDAADIASTSSTSPEE